MIPERRLGLEDKELIRRIQNGQTEYLNEIAGRYYDDIYYFCCYQTDTVKSRIRQGLSRLKELLCQSDFT